MTITEVVTMDEDELLALEEKIILKSFKGDTAAYQKAFAETGRRKLKWQDITACAEVYPELERDGIVLIANILGYRPPDYQRLPHEPFIRTLIHQSRTGVIDPRSMFIQVAEHVRSMRNKEMELYSGDYGEAIQKKYGSYLVQYRERARERLTRFLGYAPSLQTSMEAEILLRYTYADDKCHLPKKMVNTDMQVMNIVKYREVLLAHGKEAADSSPLPAISIMKQHKIL